jgi:hypothetical protein
MRKISDPKLIPILEKVVNTVINSFLQKNTDTEDKFNFTVSVRKAFDKPYVGHNAGSRGEPYNYIIEIDSDIPIPKHFVNKDDSKHGYSITKLQYEIKRILPLLNIDTESLGNVIGVFFNNVKD